MKCIITVTDHVANEWSRMAQEAYKTGHNECGHRYSVASAIYRGKDLSPQLFDALQGGYRNWLCFNEYTPS